MWKSKSIRAIMSCRLERVEMDENPNQLIIKQKSSVKYKDTLFRTLFREKDRAIELCNAVAGTDYSNDVSVIMCDM